MILIINYNMSDIKKITEEFLKIQKENTEKEDKNEKDPNSSLAEELYYWEKQLYIYKNNKEVKRHCLRQKIKQINKVNKLHKQFKIQITELVNKKLKSLPLMLFLEKIEMNENDYQKLMNGSYSKFMKIKEDNYSEDTLKGIPNPINYILDHKNIKKQWEGYKKDEKYPEIKETNYGKYMEYNYNSFTNKFCDEFVNCFGNK